MFCEREHKSNQLRKPCCFVIASTPYHSSHVTWVSTETRPHFHANAYLLTMIMMRPLHRDVEEAHDKAFHLQCLSAS